MVTEEVERFHDRTPDDRGLCENRRITQHGEAMAIIEEQTDLPVDEGTMATVVFRDVDNVPRPAIVVLHDANGLTRVALDHMKTLAEAGFVVAAPDTFHHVGRMRNSSEPGMPEGGMWLREGMTNDGHLSDMNRLAAYLQSQAYVRPGDVGITGFCLGGRISFLAGSQGVGFGPSVLFYPTRTWQSDPAVPGSPTPLSQAKVTKPMLSFFPSLDPQNPPERIAEITEALRGTPFGAVVVEGANHGFAQPYSRGFHPVEGPKAWQRCIDCFQEYLG